MPLNTKQLADIKTNIGLAEKGLKEARSDIAVAKRAGIDMTGQEKEANELTQQIRRLKAVYG